MEFLKRIFGSESFMPHATCYLNDPWIIGLHVTTDLLIFLAYTSIPATLIYFIRQRKDIPFSWMFVCFGTFIVACGLTHLMEVITVWKSVYWLSGGVKVVTAIASIGTAILLVRLVPQLLRIPSPKQLEEANNKLQKEVEERTRVSEQLRHLNESLDAKIEERTSELMQTVKELEAFTYSVSHDLRAPLRGIDAYGGMLTEDYSEQLGPDGTRKLQLIRKNAQRMGHLVDDLLTYSRLGRKTVGRCQIDVAKISGELFTDLKPEDRTIEFQVVGSSTLQGDPNMIRQVLANLIANALKFTRQVPSAQITVRTATTGKEVTVEVEDNGVGFEMEFVHKLFNVFERLHVDSQFEGNGVGLAIVKRIVQKHGGRVWAKSSPGMGSVFGFALPTPFPSPHSDKD